MSNATDKQQPLTAAQLEELAIEVSKQINLYRWEGDWGLASTRYDRDQMGTLWLNLGTLERRIAQIRRFICDKYDFEQP